MLCMAAPGDSEIANSLEFTTYAGYWEIFWDEFFNGLIQRVFSQGQKSRYDIDFWFRIAQLLFLVLWQPSKSIGHTRYSECVYLHTCICAHALSRVRLVATPWTVSCEAPLSMGFSRQEYWSRLSCPPPGDLPNPRIEPVALVSPALAGRFFIIQATGEASTRYIELPNGPLFFKIAALVCLLRAVGSMPFS